MDKALDGRTRLVTWDDLVQPRGMVLRMVQSDPAALPSFSDHIVVDAQPDERGDLQVTVARPYCFVSGAETTSPTVLTGVSQYKVAASRLVGPESLFRVVVQSRGDVARHLT